MALEVCLEHTPQSAGTQDSAAQQQCSRRGIPELLTKTDEREISNPITNPIKKYPKPETQDQRSFTLNSATPSLVELPTRLARTPVRTCPGSTQASCASTPAPGHTFGSHQIAAREAWRGSGQSFGGALILGWGLRAGGLQAWALKSDTRGMGFLRILA